MAKGKTSKKVFEISKLGGILDDIAKKVPIIIEDKVEKVDFIDSGVYLLNAALSADMLNGGLTPGRIFGLIGESGVGKSFLAYSFVKSAQKMGYYVLFIDTENAIDLHKIQTYGVDIKEDKFRLIRTNRVEDLNITLAKFLDGLKESKKEGYEVPKVMIVIDSLGMMSSVKEVDDLLDAKVKADFTRAKALNVLFRSVTSDLGYLGIPLLCLNHGYLEVGSMFPKLVGKGGNGLVYAASVLGFLSKAKLKDNNVDDMDLGASGITVTFKTEKNRLAKPKKIKFDISFVSGMNPYTGLDAFCRPEYFDQIGIAKGKMEVDKKTGKMEFKPGGTRWYVEHLGKTVTMSQLLTANVFTQEVLEKIAPIVNDYFRFKSLDEMVEIENKFDKLLEDGLDDDGFAYDLPDADDIF